MRFISGDWGRVVFTKEHAIPCKICEIITTHDLTRDVTEVMMIIEFADAATCAKYTDDPTKGYAQIWR